MKPRHVLLAVSVPVIWGLGFTFAKAALADFPPVLLMALRFTLTAVALVWFVKPPRRLMGRIFLIALVGGTIQYGLTFTGLQHLDASTAIIVIQLEVPFATLLSALFLNDRLGWRRTLGMALAFAGVVLIAGEPRIRDDLGPVLLVASGALAWAVGQVLIKTLGRVGGFTLIAWVAVFTAPQMFVASALVESGQLAALARADWVVWGAVVYLGLVMTALGYAIWYHLLGVFRVTQVMPFLLLLPVVTMAGGVVFLGETITPPVFAGAAVVIAGIAVITVERRPAVPWLPITVDDARAVARAWRDAGGDEAAALEAAVGAFRRRYPTVPEADARAFVAALIAGAREG